jgi:hypothetical protein
MLDFSNCSAICAAGWCSGVPLCRPDVTSRPCQGTPQLGFQKAVIEAVARVTHIALPDDRGMIIGAEVQTPGVIYYDMKKLFLCGGFSDAEFQTITEVYPDSPKVNANMCSDAQVAAICGGLDYIK